MHSIISYSNQLNIYTFFNIIPSLQPAICTFADHTKEALILQHVVPKQSASVYVCRMHRHDDADGNI